ncbi:MAG: DNA repair protein RadC [Eubacterium sp.]|nr:DNA repair protein RadC [Eubacterium sp.]
MDKQQDDRIGHRKRMLKAFAERGSSSFEDYQMLEMVLFYVIPRKDVKPIAKALLKHFGSLENVLSASKKQLMNIPGVGNETAVYLNLIFDVFLRLRDNRCKEQKTIKSLDDAADYFKEMYQFENKDERLAVMMLDSSNTIINCIFLSEGSVNAMEVNARKLMEQIIGFNASSVIIAHNHPNGLAYPSMEDVNFTLNVREMLKNMGVTLVDHVILNNKEAFSMHSDLEFVDYFERNSESKNIMKS